jgi:hypothetical protein
VFVLVVLAVAFLAWGWSSAAPVCRLGLAAAVAPKAFKVHQLKRFAAKDIDWGKAATISPISP